MFKLTKTTVITAVLHSILMATLFARDTIDETHIPLLTVSALAHSAMFVIITREFATMSIKGNYLRLFCEIMISVLVGVMCTLFAIDIQIDIKKGALVPNGDIASFALIIVATSIAVTVITFLTFVTRSDKLMTEIRSDLDTDRQPLT